MQYKDFTNRIKRSGVSSTIRSYGHLIEQMEDGKVFIDGAETKFNTLEEARTQVKHIHLANKLEEQISTELYEEISVNTIASIIKEHHDIKVTDTLIESYVQLASSRMFSIDPVVQQIRKLNKLDTVVEGKLHYVLNDGSIVAINEQTQEKLNNLLHNQTEVIDYMRESKDNFLYIIEHVKE